MSTARKPLIRSAGEGEQIDVVGDRYRFLAVAGETDGKYAIWEAVVPAGGGPPPHRHSREEEGFYVLEGEVTFHTEEGAHVAGPGAFVQLPRHSLHWFCNESDAPAKMLILVAPGGMEEMFQETGVPVRDLGSLPAAPTAAEIAKLKVVAPRYGVQIVTD